MSESEIKDILKSRPAVLLYFFSETCSACSAFRPYVENLPKQYSELLLVWIDAKNHPEICPAFGVYESPTLLLFFDGKETRRFGRFVSIQQIKEAIDRPYQMLFGQN